ncbi:hypothetical protein niasHT_002305 [Heterodera trifolii]|uniref:Nematode cuticle collagen N-terminal domain-containing protein n=1 Tax=Heterodera trifolii TaxID=157864 RepID=A0ABD2LLT1_9BILA
MHFLPKAAAKSESEDSFKLADRSNSEREEKQKEIDYARRLAILCVSFSTLSMLCACVAVPSLLTASLSLQSELQLETDFCHVRLRDIWSQIANFGDDVKVNWHGESEERTEHARGKREPKNGGAWLFGRFISDVPFPRVHAAPLTEPHAPIPSGAFSASGTTVGGYGGYGASLQKQTEEEYGGKSGQTAPPKADVYGMEIARESPNLSTASAQSSAFSPGGSNAYGVNPISAAFPPAIKPPSASDQASVCCCCQGPPGTPGDAGEDGENGSDGLPGAPGQEGRSGEIIAHDVPVKEPCVICPQGSAGPAGPQGPRGPPGPRGANGNSGIDGKRGEPGMEGSPGPIGNIGPVGPQGPPGIPGRQFITEGPRGSPGKPGPKGPKGLPGCQGVPGITVQGVKGPPGDAGRPGKDGRRGQQGTNGTPGLKGTSGDCFHCPPPRTPPGY